MRFRTLSAAAGSFLLVLLGAAPAFAQSASVSVVDNSFNPKEVEVEAGGTVTWTNEGQSPHTVTADDGSFDSGTLDPGDTYDQSFDTAGRYPYYCQFHGAAGGTGMSGVVVVTEGGGGGNGNGGGNGGGGNGGGGNGGGGGGDETTNPTDLPNTGVEITGFLYLALALIAAGGALVKLGSEPLLGRR